MPAQLGDRAGRPAEPAARTGPVGQRRDRRVPASRTTAPTRGPDGRARPRTARCSVSPSTARNVVTTGHRRVLQRIPQGGRMRVTLGRDRRHPADDQRVDVVPVGHRAHRVGQLGRSHLDPEVDRRAVGHHQPGVQAEVDGQHAQRAGVAHDADPVAASAPAGWTAAARRRTRRSDPGCGSPRTARTGWPPRPRTGVGRVERWRPDRASTCECRPDLTAITGLVRASTLASRANLRGLPNDSRYSSTTSVRSSPCQYCSRSLPETSARLPADDEGGQAQPTSGGVGQDGHAQRAGLAEEADPTGRRHHRGQRGVQSAPPDRC